MLLKLIFFVSSTRETSGTTTTFALVDGWTIMSHLLGIHAAR